MPIFENWPYTDVHQLNLDWLLEKVKANEENITTIENTLESLNIENSKLLFASAVLSTSDDNADTLAALSDSILVLDSGVYPVNSDCTLPINVIAIGGLLQVNNATLTLSRKLYADRVQVFDLNSGAIAPKMNTTGFPEWFGAVTDDNTVDNTPYIKECFDTFIETSLDAKDYYINTTLVLATSHHKLTGDAKKDSLYTISGNDKGTRLMMLDNTVDAVHIGSLTTTTYDVTQIYFEHLNIVNVDPDYSINTYGVKVKLMRALHMKYVQTTNFTSGFYMGNILLSFVDHCRYICNKDSSSTSTAYGMVLGQDTPIADGVLASISGLFIGYCEIHFNNNGRNQYGIYSSGTTGLADLEIDTCSFFRCTYGIKLVGSANNVFQQNIWIKNNTIDDNIDGVILSGPLKCHVVDNLITVGAYLNTLTAHAVWITDVTGTGEITLANNQIKCADARTGANYGLRIVDSKAITSNCDSLMNFTNPALISTSENCYFNVMVKNNKATSSAYAFTLGTCSHCKVDIGLTGDYTYAGGVSLVSTSTYCEVDPTRIDPANVSSYMVSNAGSAVTSSQLFTVLTNNVIVTGLIS